MTEMTFEAAVESIPMVTEFVDAQLEAHDCSPKAQLQIDVAIDEILCNIAYYAYKPGTGSVTVQLEVKDGCAFLTFIDSGVPFNPLISKEPDVSLSAEERDIGGLGIFLVKKTMDELEYERHENQNVLKIVKKIDG